MLAEEILQVARRGEEAEPALPLRRRELHRVADALERDPQPVQGFLAGLGAEALDGGDEPAELLPREAAERHRLHPLGQSRGSLEPRQQAPVCLTVENVEQPFPRGLSLAAEGGEQKLSRRVVVLPQGLQLAVDVLEQDVDVADGAGGRTEMTQIGGQRTPPASVERAPRRPEEGARPPGSNAMLVQVLRVAPDAGSRIVREHRPPLLLQHLPQANGARIGAERRRGEQRLACHDRIEQRRHRARWCETLVSGLPLLHALAAGQDEPPHDPGLGGQPRQRHSEPLQIAIGGVVVVDDRELPLRLQPVLDRARRVLRLRDLERARSHRLHPLVRGGQSETAVGAAERSALPCTSSATTETYPDMAGMPIAVSKPVRLRVAIGFRASFRFPATTCHAATPVAPFQLT